MTRYTVTGRPVGAIIDEIGHLGVGATLDADLTSEREAELIDRRILSIDQIQELPDNGSDTGSQPEPDSGSGPGEADRDQSVGDAGDAGDTDAGDAGDASGEPDDEDDHA